MVEDGGVEEMVVAEEGVGAAVVSQPGGDILMCSGIGQDSGTPQACVVFEDVVPV